jgi:hypothetical protein
MGGLRLCHHFQPSNDEQELRSWCMRETSGRTLVRASSADLNIRPTLLASPYGKKENIAGMIFSCLCIHNLSKSCLWPVLLHALKILFLDTWIIVH